MLRKDGPIQCHCAVCDTDFSRARNRGSMTACAPCQRAARLAKWIADNPCKKNEYNRKWSAENKQREAEMKKAWEIANRPALNHRAALHRAKRRKATPAWADIGKIKEIYQACPPGHHVDHIIPLHGRQVTGLHVENNLQYLPAYENRSKSNKFLEGNP